MYGGRVRVFGIVIPLASIPVHVWVCISIGLVLPSHGLHGVERRQVVAAAPIKETEWMGVSFLPSSGSWTVGICYG